MDQKWSPTTGANILTRFDPTAKEPFRYRAKANGFDRRGDQLWNEFILLAVHPAASNATFSTVTVRSGLRTITMRLFHNTRYLTPLNQKGSS